LQIFPITGDTKDYHEQREDRTAEEERH